jgi:hypothetical protein
MKSNISTACKWTALIGLTFFGSLGTSAFAGLEFEETHIKIEADPAQDKIPVTFKFKVTGENAVTVKEIQTTCGCIKAETDKASYEPGESGQVDSLFTVGSFEGEHIKSMYVINSDAATGKIPLRITINVPKLFEIEPEVQKWKVNEEPLPKKINFKVLHKDPVEILSLTLSRKSFTAMFKEIVKGREYEITLTPSSTNKPILGALSVHTNCAIERHKRKLVIFSVSRR